MISSYTVAFSSTEHFGHPHVSKTSDNVCRSSLLYKLYKLGVPCGLVYIIRNFCQTAVYAIESWLHSINPLESDFLSSRTLARPSLSVHRDHIEILVRYLTLFFFFCYCSKYGAQLVSSVLCYRTTIEWLRKWKIVAKRAVIFCTKKISPIVRHKSTSLSLSSDTQFLG